MTPQRLIKSVLDRGAATILLIALMPLLLLVAAVIHATMGSPVLFRQRRPGFRGRPFVLVKFRTMRDASGPDGRPLPDEHRLPRVGRVIRATSLDELPQLWNVIRGELSFVGPRPLLMRYLDRYSPEQARRHDVMPGITGWSQVNGRNALDWETKLALDVWYVDNWSLLLDLRILLLTVLRVIDRRGVSQDGHVTMPEFMGRDGSTGEASMPNGRRSATPGAGSMSTGERREVGNG